MLKKLREPTHVVTQQVITDLKDIVPDMIGRCQAYIQQTNVKAVAANQVNGNYRILVYQKDNGDIVNCINPFVIKKIHPVQVIASDPSFPNLACRVDSYNKITVSYLQADGVLKKKEVKLKGYTAYKFLQAMDLLDGVIIFDNAISTNYSDKYFKVIQVATECRECGGHGKVENNKEKHRYQICGNCQGLGRVGKPDYYIEGENVLWFSGLKIDPLTTKGHIVGVKTDIEKPTKQPESKIITL